MDNKIDDDLEEMIKFYDLHPSSYATSGEICDLIEKEVYLIEYAPPTFSVSIFNSENTELIWASYNGNLDEVNRLLKHIENNKFSINVNLQDKYGRTALIFASKYGYTDVVRALCCLENRVIRNYRLCITQNIHPIDFNLYDKNENTALIWASRGGHLDVVNILIKYKDIINVNFQNRFENALEAA